METYCGHVRTPQDAIKLFEACRLGLLPRVQRRLSEKERQSIKSGSVFVWDEREAGMRRWTDGKSWSASRVSGSFLTYREMEGKRGGGNFVPSVQKPRAAGKTPDSGRGSDEDADMDGEGPDGYRYKPDGLMKQSFSITTSSGQHLHLISYYCRPPPNAPELLTPSTDHALRHIQPLKGMYPESTIHDQAQGPAVTRAPMQGAYSPAPHHLMAPSGPLPPGSRPPYPYQGPPGYNWPPSPVSTPPYANYPGPPYASQLPPPQGSGHPSPHQYPHLPPGGGPHPPPQHISPYDRQPLSQHESSLPPPPPGHYRTSGPPHPSQRVLPPYQGNPNGPHPPPPQTSAPARSIAEQAVQRISQQSGPGQHMPPIDPRIAGSPTPNARMGGAGYQSSGPHQPGSNLTPIATAEANGAHTNGNSGMTTPVTSQPPPPSTAQTIPSIQSLVNAPDDVSPRNSNTNGTANGGPVSRHSSRSPNSVAGVNGNANGKGENTTEGPRDIPPVKLGFSTNMDARATRLLDRKFCT